MNGLYNLASGAMLGQALIHDTPHATMYGEWGFKLRIVFVIIGIVLMRAIDTFTRVSRDHQHFIGEPTGRANINGMFTSSGDEGGFVSVGDADSSDTAVAVWADQSARIEMRKRRLLAVIYFVLMIFR